MPIAVIINIKINDNCLFWNHRKSLVMPSGFAVPEESLCGHDWMSVRALRIWGAVFGGVRLCRAMDSPQTLATNPSGAIPGVRAGGPAWSCTTAGPPGRRGVWGRASACEGGKMSPLTATGAFPEGSSWELLTRLCTLDDHQRDFLDVSATRPASPEHCQSTAMSLQEWLSLRACPARRHQEPAGTGCPHKPSRSLCNVSQEIAFK